jgi:hypothetical protein
MLMLARIALLVVLVTLPSLAQAGLMDFVSGAANETLDVVDGVSKWKDAAPEAMRREKCADEQGVWVNNLQVSECVDGQVTLWVDGQRREQPCSEGHHGGSAKDQCAHYDNQGAIYFNDGPSVPPAMLTISSWIDDSIDQIRYNEVLWPAGVAHDYCYHGNPVTYGKSKADCDEQFIADLVALCLAQEPLGEGWFHTNVCKGYASGMYGAVRAGGGDSWAGFNLQAAYPLQGPMWQQLGLKEEPETADIKRDVDAMLTKFNLVEED